MPAVVFITACAMVVMLSDDNEHNQYKGPDSAGANMPDLSPRAGYSEHSGNSIAESGEAPSRNAPIIASPSAALDGEQVTNAIGSLSPSSDTESIAVLAFRCRNIPKTASELDEWVSTATQNNESPELIDSVVAKHDDCKALYDKVSYVELLLKAAEAGSEEAVDILWYLNNNELIDGFDLQHLPREDLIEKLAALRSEKYQLTQKVALMGGEKAMLRLMRGYQQFDPETQGQSFVKSLAYALLLQETTENNDNYRRANWHSNHLQTKMTLDEIRRATELAIELRESYPK